MAANAYDVRRLRLNHVRPVRGDKRRTSEVGYTEEASNGLLKLNFSARAKLSEGNQLDGVPYLVDKNPPAAYPAENPRTKGGGRGAGRGAFAWMEKAAWDMQGRRGGQGHFRGKSPAGFQVRSWQDQGGRKRKPEMQWRAVCPKGTPFVESPRRSERTDVQGTQDGVGEGSVIGYVQILEQALVAAKATSDSQEKTTPPNSRDASIEIESPGKSGQEPRQKGCQIDLADAAERLSAAVADGASENDSDAGRHDRGDNPEDVKNMSWTDMALEAAALVEEAQAAAVRAAEALAAVATAANAASAQATAKLNEGASEMAELARRAAAVRAEAVACASQETVSGLMARAEAAAEEARDERPEIGDVVTLGSRAPEEHRGSAAVVTAVAEKHCTVFVLDESRRYGVGECWPSFGDVSVQTSHYRLDSQVRLVGLTNSKTIRLNGFTGRVCAHKREGHPVWIHKPADPERPQFTICVRMDDPLGAGEKQVMLEPRFLEPV